MRNLHHLLFAVAAIAATGTSADAKPRRLVVVDFDGLPRPLADSGRASVMTQLGDLYDIVNTKKWESAKAEVPGRGQLQWRQAAKKSGVDAVIEGWVNSEGRHHTLTVQVKDATTGIELDSVSVNMGDKGLTDAATKSLMKQLDDILNWVDGDATSWDVHSPLPPVEKPALTGHKFYPSHDEDADEDDGPDSAHRASGKYGRAHRDEYRRDDDRDRDRDHGDRDRGDRDRGDRDRGDRDRDRSDRDSDDRGSDRDRDRDRDRSDRDKPGLTRTAQVDATPPAKAGDDLLPFFAPDSKESEIVAQTSAPKIVHAAPRFFIEGGGFVASRGMTFTHDPPDSQMGTPDYPAQGLQGIALGGAFYPAPTEKLSNDPSGIGFSFHLQKSVGSLFSAYDPDANTYGDYTIDHTAYEGAVHYRIPTDLLVADGDIAYGSFAYTIANDPYGGIQIPDVNYTYISLGGTLDLKVTDRTRIGFGGHYMYLLDAGDVSTEESYGSGAASGLDLETHFQIPISDALFVRGQLDYRRVSMDFEGTGNVGSMLEIGNITDSTIGGQLEIGVQF